MYITTVQESSYLSRNLAKRYTVISNTSCEGEGGGCMLWWCPVTLHVGCGHFPRDPGDTSGVIIRVQVLVM